MASEERKEAFLRAWFDTPEGVHWAHGMSNEIEQNVSDCFDKAIAAWATPVAPVSPDENEVSIPRNPTEAMMNAGLYHCSHDMEWSDLFTAWQAMFDAVTLDGGITEKAKATVSPDATGKCGELVTVAYQFYADLEWFETFFPDDKVKQGYQVRELCDRSQAVELLVAERAKLTKEEADHTRSLEERDRYHNVADKLAHAIADRYQSDIGEHSSINDPWQNALNLIEADNASDEKERLRFEGDLDKWMKIIGAGITGYQPEAYTLMDFACEELVTLRADNATLKAGIKRLSDEQELLAETGDGDMISVVKLAARLSDAEADASRWHQKAMDAGVIVHSDGTTSHPMRKECDDLKADNAALTARVKELEQALETEKTLSRGDWSCQRDVDQMSIKIEALEAKLAATEPLLTIWDELPDNTSSAGLMAVWFIKAGTIVREARAALGGKP